MAELKSTSIGLGKRDRSSTTRWAEESRKQARDSGELPHEFLLRVARGLPIDCFDYDDTGNVVLRVVYPTFSDRVDAANQCANYFAPKLTAQQVEQLDPVTEMTDEELNRKLAELEGR